MTPMDAVQRMVLHAARPFPGEDTLVELRRLMDGSGGGAAPADVLDVATRTRTLPQVARSVGLASGGRLPPGWEALGEGALRVACRNLSHIRALVLLVDGFDSVGIPVIAYKGPVMAQSLYGNATLRQYKDLDVLVEPEHVPNAVATLRRGGYREVSPSRRLSPGQLRGMTRWFREHHMSFVHPDTRVQVELHWALLPRIRFTAASELARHPVEQPFGGRTLLTLRPEALLVYLCAHGCKHGWKRLSWVADVRAFLLSLPDTDWDAAWSLGERIGLTGAMVLGLALAESAMDTPLPAPLQLRLAPHRDGLDPLLQAARRSIWTCGGDGSPAAALEEASNGGTRGGALRYIAARALPGLHLLEGRLLPAPLFPLYLLDNLRHQVVRSTQLLMGREGGRT